MEPAENPTARRSTKLTRPKLTRPNSPDPNSRRDPVTKPRSWNREKLLVPRWGKIPVHIRRSGRTALFGSNQHSATRRRKDCGENAVCHPQNRLDRSPRVIAAGVSPVVLPDHRDAVRLTRRTGRRERQGTSFPQQIRRFWEQIKSPAVLEYSAKRVLVAAELGFSTKMHEFSRLESGCRVVDAVWVNAGQSAGQTTNGVTR